MPMRSADLAVSGRSDLCPDAARLIPVLSRQGWALGTIGCRLSRAGSQGRLGRTGDASRPSAASKRWACPGALNRRRRRSRWRPGWWRFSARGCRSRCGRCSMLDRRSRLAAPALPRCSVVLTRGASVHPLSRVRKHGFMAVLIHGPLQIMMLPVDGEQDVVERTRAPRRGRRRQWSLPKACPHFCPHWRMVSSVTITPHSAPSSATSRSLRPHRTLSQTP
jgi:hypothetical protein